MIGLAVPGGGWTDAHLHLWEPAPGRYRWMERAPQLRRPARWQDVGPVLGEAGVTRVVLVQAEDSARETSDLQRVAAAIERERTPVRRADVVAWVPLTEPDTVDGLLADEAWRRRVVGVRHLVHDDPDPGFLERPDVDAGLSLLATAGLPLDVPDAYPRHLDQAARLAAAHPGLTIVLDHLGKPPLGDGTRMRDWERQLRRLAAAGTTVAKISGLATAGTGHAAAVEDALEVALDAFGADRLMMGSDWPIAPTPFDAATGMGPVLGWLSRCDARTRRVVLRDTAERVYRRAASR